MVQAILSAEETAGATNNTFTRLSDLLLYITGVCILAPVYEELMRVITMMNLWRVMNKKKWILIIQASIFAICHVSPGSVFAAFIGGYILGKIYNETGNIKNNILAHMAFNIFALIPQGSSLWSGIIFTVALLLFVIIWKKYRKEREDTYDV